MFVSKRKLKNTECIDQIKRGISLAKVCLTCKNHATFLENSELFIAGHLAYQEFEISVWYE